ncbi:MFS transporter [Geodermatophilus sp. YIM 151500]|uniref:MFS transporter n=1 Tax=Geodermatophilus sp. YIM 151500 TaxID=2984531 RepID=UPI0021E508DC|nr:MFS transporter [Geodermatophilus sp. YIM 151500]MCV2488153.1 MFS transporter [Geodermatophilus sp. YIM 151500]
MSTPALFSRARTPVAGLARSTRARLPEPSAARLRAAVTVLFVLDGAVFGSWAARVPGVAAQVGAGHTALGVALLCLSLGALVCMRLTGRWCARFGAGPVSAAAGVAVCLSALLPGLAGSVPVLCAALLVFGAATGMVNVAANALGVQVEARVGRPLLSGLHAGFSLGGLAGALVGGAAAAVLGVAPHLALVAAAGLAATAWALPALLGAPRAPLPAPGPAPDAAPADGPDAAPGDGPAARRRTAALVVLGAVAGCTAFGEGALTDWGALLLREELGAPATLGALGYAGFASAMAGGRLAGGWLLLTLGERRLLAGGALLAAVGATVAVTTPVLWVALAGFVVVGLGLSNVFPLAIARAGLIGGAPGIALATTVGYTGLLGGPPLIGLVAEHAGLPAALGSVALLALAAGFLVLTVVGDRVLVTAPAGAVTRRVTRVGERLQPVVSGFGHGTGVYVRELTTLLPSGGDPSR